MAGAPLISIVVPCYNEHDNLIPFLEAFEAAAPHGYQYEVLFVNDGSTDDTSRLMMQLVPKREDVVIRPLNLSRNFGKEATVTAGLHQANGAAAIIIDADLQHPPAVIKKFLKDWQAGSDIVIGVREDDKKYAPLYKRLGSKLFYKIINRISSIEIIPRATDFRLLDRAVIDEFNKFNEHDRITRGLVDWLGFERTTVSFVPGERLHGVAAYSFRKLTGLALNSFIAMSLFPLKMAGYGGMIVTILFGALGAIVFTEMYIFNDPLQWNVSTSADLAIVIVFLVGIILMALGLIALYIATIHTEVTNRPLYVIRPAKTARPRPVRG